MAKSKRTYFIVQGSYTFPYDMLRYDQCWPVSEIKDSFELIQTPYSEPKGVRRIMLATDAVSSPNHHRWLSFGWVVIAMAKNEYEIEKYRDIMVEPPFLLKMR